MRNFTIILVLLISYSIRSQVGIGIPNPDASAVLELSSNKKGFLPPRLTTVQRDAIINPTEGLTIYNTTKNCLEWYLTTGWYNACGDNGIATVTNYVCTTLETGTMMEGNPISRVSQTITATVSSIGSYNISATANGVTFSARGNFTSLGNHQVVLHATGTPIRSGDHDFILNTSPNSCTFKRTTDIFTVVGKAGRIWMAYNLGATAIATSSNDASQYGDYYQWGRETDSHEKLNSPTRAGVSLTNSPGHGDFLTGNKNWRAPHNNNLWQGITGINNPCPAGFRVPTNQEWEDEFRQSKITNAATAYTSPLKLPVAGSRDISGNYKSIGSCGFYWTSDAGAYGIISEFQSFCQANTSHDNEDRSFGMSVRCIKD